jgi:uncharacterized protein (TIRG00374 family)
MPYEHSDNESRAKQMKKLKYIAQFAISSLCLIVLFRIIEPNQIKIALRNAEISSLVIVFVLVAPAIFVRAWRWHYILKRKNIYVSLATMYRITFIGSALNLFLPGGAGDVARSYYGWQSLGHKEAMLASAFSDKVVALFSLCILGFVCALNIRADEMAWVSALLAIPLGLLLYGRWRYPWVIVSRLFRRFLKREFDADKLIDIFHMDERTLGVTVLVSLIGWIITNATYYYACLTFSKNADLWYISAIAPLINLMRIVPVTVSGLGSADALIVVLFNTMGVLQSESLAASMTSNLALIALPGLIGASLLLFHRKKDNAAALSDERRE